MMQSMWLPTEAFGLVCGSVYEDFSTDDRAVRHKHLRQVRICTLLRQVVDKKVAAFRP